MMQDGTEDALEASKFANQILVGSALMRAPTSNFLEIPEKYLSFIE